MHIKNRELKEVRNIIFDLGNVLLDIDISLTIEALKKLGLTNFKESEIHPHNAGIFLELELGKITNQEFYDKIKGYATGVVPSDEQIKQAWNALLLPFDYERFELLDKLRKNYKIFLLSNTNLPHRECMFVNFKENNPAGKDFESYFDACFYSDAMHLRKPNIRIYQTLLQETGIRAEETLFIDDNAPNLPTAEELGIKTHHLVKGESVFDLFE